MQVSAFVSYGHQDASEFVRRLTADLADAGVSPVWLDSDMITSGQNWTTAIETGLKQADVVLAVMTRRALRQDSICHNEHAFARNENRRIIPIRPAGPAPKPSLLLVTLSWADFSGDYDTALAKLVSALQGNDSGLVKPTQRIAGQRPLDFGLDLARHSRQGFVGRQWLFEAIDAWMAGDRGRILLILGEPGIGKSAITALLARRPDCAAVHFCRQDNTPSIDPIAFVAAIAACLAARVPGFADALAERNPEEPQPDAVTAFRQLVAEPATAIPAPDTVQLIVVDALDESLSFGRDTILALLAAHAGSLPLWLRIVATSRPETEVLRSLEQLTSYPLDAGRPENRDDVAAFVRANAPAELTDTIITAANGNFLCAVRITGDLADGTLTRAQVSSLSPGIASYYDTSFRRLFPDADSFEDLGRPFLQPLVAALSNLPIDVLETATQLSQREFRKARRLLRSFLACDHEGTQQETISLFHKSLTDWLLRGNTALGVLSRKRGASSVADAMKTLPADDTYRLEWLVSYLMDSARDEEARDTCLEPQFLSEKLEADLVRSLRRDVDETLCRTPHPKLAALSRLLRQSQHLLRRVEPKGSATTTLRSRCFGHPALESYVAELTPHCADPFLAPVRPLPDQPSPALLHTLTGHTDTVTALAWNSTGTLLATASLDGTVCFRNATTGDSVRQLTGHTDAVHRLAWNPSSTLVATGSGDGTVRVWNPATGSNPHVLTGHTGVVDCLAWSSHGTLLATAGHDGTVRLWESTTGRTVHTLHHGDRVGAVSWNPANTLVASAGWSDATVLLWDPLTGHALRTFTEQRGWGTAAAWNPSGTLLAIASQDGTIGIWNQTADRIRLTLTGHTDAIAALAWNPSGTLLLSTSYDDTARIWDPTTGTTLRTLRGQGAGMDMIAWDPTGNLVAIASGNGTAFICNPATGETLTKLTGHSSSINCIAWNPTSTLLATSSWDGSARIWDHQAAGGQAVVVGHSNTVLSIALNPTRSLLATASVDGTVRIWDATAGLALACFTGHEDLVGDVAWDRRGALLATTSHDGTARIWDLDGNPVQILTGHNDSLSAIAWSPTTSLLATASWDGTARIWDPTTGNCLRRLKGHTALVSAVAWSPTGTVLATTSHDGTARIWNSTTGKTIQALVGHSAAVLAIAWNPKGTLLATTSNDETARIWDPRTGRTLGTLTGLNYEVSPLVWNPGGTLLATAREDGTACIWETATGRTVHTLVPHSDFLSSLDWNPRGTLLATSSGDRTLRLWDPGTGEPKSSICLDSPLTDVFFTSDAAIAASGGNHVYFLNVNKRGLFQGR